MSETVCLNVEGRVEILVGLLLGMHPLFEGRDEEFSDFVEGFLLLEEPHVAWEAESRILQHVNRPRIPYSGQVGSRAWHLD